MTTLPEDGKSHIKVSALLSGKGCFQILSWYLTWGRKKVREAFPFVRMMLPLTKQSPHHLSPSQGPHLNTATLGIVFLHGLWKGHIWTTAVLKVLVGRLSNLWHPTNLGDKSKCKWKGTGMEPCCV